MQVDKVSSRAHTEVRFLWPHANSWQRQYRSSSQPLYHDPSSAKSSRSRYLYRQLSSSSILQSKISSVKFTPPAIIAKTAARAYHSELHAPFLPTHEYSNSQTAILTAALEHVPTHGFTKDALTLGARDVGFLDVSLQLFTRQEMDLVLFWLASRRGLLSAQVEGGLFTKQQTSDNDVSYTTKGELTVEDKVRMLVRERLRMNENIIHKWQEVSILSSHLDCPFLIGILDFLCLTRNFEQALAIMSLPTNIPLALSELHTLASDILYLAGDTTVDASWYTKRLSLATIYASAEVIMTQDQSSSPKFAATEAFVDRRIQDNQIVGETITDAKRYLSFLINSAVSLGRSWGLKV
jgi:ubiquinone biosynthesis protein COQ9